MTFVFPEKLPQEWLESFEKGQSIQINKEGTFKVVGRDHRGVIVKTGGDSFKILHNGKNQNAFGNPLLPNWKDVTVTEDEDFISVDNADGFVFKFRKGTAGYNEILLDEVQLIADERWVLEYLAQTSGQWRQRGEPQSVEWEQPETYHVIVRRFFRDFESPETTFYVVWDFYGGFRPKISVEATIGQEDTYRLRWSVSGINKNNFSDETDKKQVKLWNLDEEAIVLDYTDIYEQLGAITEVDSSEWASGKKLTLNVNVGTLLTGKFRLDPNFGYELIGGLTQNPHGRITGSVFTCPAAGTAISITAYYSGSSTYVVSSKHAIYLHSTLARLAVSASAAKGVVAEWKLHNLTTTPALLAATDYVLVIWTGGTPGGPSNPAFYYADGDGPDPGNQGHYQDLAYDSFPNPLVPTGHEDKKYSIYCTYTVPGWTGKISGVVNPAEIAGVAVANVASVKGVA